MRVKWTKKWKSRCDEQRKRLCRYRRYLGSWKCSETCSIHSFIQKRTPCDAIWRLRQKKKEKIPEKSALIRKLAEICISDRDDGRERGKWTMSAIWRPHFHGGRRQMKKWVTWRVADVWLTFSPISRASTSVCSPDGHLSFVYWVPSDPITWRYANQPERATDETHDERHRAIVEVISVVFG